MTAIEPDLDVQLGIAASKLLRAREAERYAELRLIELLCKKYSCAPGARVIRTNTAQVKRKRPIWIVTKVIVDRLDLSVTELTGRPRIWARRRDHHDIPSSHYEKQLWTYWEPAP